jgi:hypothetical protein
MYSFLPHIIDVVRGVWYYDRDFQTFFREAAETPREDAAQRAGGGRALAAGIPEKR